MYNILSVTTKINYMKIVYLFIVSILLVVCACEKKDYDVPVGEGRVSVCNIKNPRKDLRWLDNEIDNEFRKYKRDYKYLTVYFGIFLNQFLIK